MGGEDIATFREYINGSAASDPFSYDALGGAYRWASPDTLELQSGFASLGQVNTGFAYIIVASNTIARFTVGIGGLAANVMNRQNAADVISRHNGEINSVNVSPIGTPATNTLTFDAYPGSVIAMRAGGEKGDVWGIDSRVNQSGSVASHLSIRGRGSVDRRIGGLSVPSILLDLTSPNGVETTDSVTTYTVRTPPQQNLSLTLESIRRTDVDYGGVFEPDDDYVPYGDRRTWTQGVDLDGVPWKVEFTHDGGEFGYTLIVDDVVIAEGLNYGALREQANAAVVSLRARKGDDPFEPLKERGTSFLVLLAAAVLFGVLASSFAKGLGAGVASRGSGA